MKLLPLDKLKAREVAGGIVEFGIFLPWVSASDGYQLWVKTIHEQDQFLQDIQQPQFRNGDYFFYNHSDRYHSKNILLFSRYTQEKFSLVTLNFSDSKQTVPFWFPIAGNYQEELHRENNLTNVISYEQYWLTIPSNYGNWTVTST